MSKRKKSTRMFTRQQRQANRAVVEAIPADMLQARAEDALVCALFGGRTPELEDLADAWLDLHGLATREPDEAHDMNVLARVYRRRTGRALTTTEAESYEDAREQLYEDAFLTSGEAWD